MKERKCRIIQIITTHLSGTPTSITSPRTGDHSDSQLQQPVYTLDRSLRKVTNTQGLFWRWSNYFQRAWSWSWNAAYACGYLVPWCSPIGIRALLSNHPFYADLELCQVYSILPNMKHCAFNVLKLLEKESVLL